MDILDTSVIRGMRKRDILALRQDRRIAISPFTLWEILCHLDEVSTGEDAATAFGRRRGHVAVLHELECLHDPFADHAEAIGEEHLANPTRFEDRDLARQLMAAVISATSLAELEGRQFVYPDGRRASFRNLAANARAALQTEEQRFIANTRAMWDRLRKHHGYTRPSDLSDNDVWSWLRAMLTALRNSGRDQLRSATSELAFRLRHARR